ncbi:MAG: EscU/YscU/HrcU family type III secretion system export apparatus switch protein [Spirochaetaceae bacterium]
MPERAVAIKYDSDLPAPFLVAKGERRMAQRIREIAQESGIPVSQDAVTADLLYTVDVGDFIPEDLYAVVARLLVYAYQVELQSR